MSKKYRKRKSKALVPEVIHQNSTDNTARKVQNDFASSMQQWGMVFPQGLPYSTQISQPTTIFHNLRWWLVSNLRQMLSEAYVELGLVQNIVDVPVDDALRGGVEVTTKQLSEEQVAQLMAEFDEQGDLETAGQGGKWNRLYGGGAIMIFTDQDPQKPLNIDAISEDEDLEFRAVDMWELFYDYQTVGEFDDKMQDFQSDYYDYYGERIHKSRVIPLKGIMAPSFIRPRLRGWGVSVVETLVRSINQYLKATDLVYEVLDEFKIDVYKINNLVASNFAPGGAEQGSVRDRIEMVNWQKNFQNAIVLDAQDDWTNKQLNFTGLAEVQSGIRMQVASDMRMPMTKLFGMSAQGFNSGEDDIEVYNGMIESSVRNKLKYPIVQMLKLRCQKLFGFVPDDLAIAFKPLRVLGAVEEENVKTQTFTRILQANERGLISARLFFDMCNRANVFPMKIDTNKELLGLDSDPDDSAREEPEFSPRESKEGEDSNVIKGEFGKSRKSSPSARVANRQKRRVSNSRGSGSTVPKQKPLAVEQPKPAIFVLPDAYSKREKAKRLLNSIAFDKASYEADGGDGWIDPRRREFFQEPVGVDQMLWGKARIRSQEIYGSIRWQFVAWFYRKLGGRFAA